MKLLLTVSFYLAVFLTAVQVVVTRHEARRLFVELQALEKTQDALKEEWGRLQLEQSTWAINDRVESVARVNLQMRMPDKSYVVLIQE